MKKILASVAAAALTVSAMAVAASAADVPVSGTGKMTDEGGGVRLTVFNPWGDDEMKLIDWAKVEGTKEVTVKFKAEGVTDAFTAELTISNFEEVQYWGAGSDNTNASADTITVSEDGEYAVTVKLDVPYTIQDNNFLAVQTNAPFVEDGDLVLTLVSVTVADPAPADPEPGAGPTEGPGSDPEKDKEPVDSGVEGVAVVAGLAIVAAGAVVIAKKRG